MAWKDLLSKCYNKRDPNYRTHGKKGIQVCPAWRTNFYAFLKDMGMCPSINHGIEREDRSMGYDAENCRWVHQYSMHGRRMSLARWCKELNINHAQAVLRIEKLGWSYREALTPIESRKVTFDEETKTLAEWCDLLGLDSNEVYLRVLRGEEPDEILAQ